LLSYREWVELPAPGEVLGEDWEEPWTDRLWQALLRRPLALPLLVIVGLVVAGSGAAALTTLGARVARVTVSPSDSSAPMVAPWQTGANGRPSGPVVLSVEATVRRGSSGAATTVVGIAGPGVIGSDNPAVLVPIGESVTVPLRAEVDCRRLPEVIPRGAYGLRTNARSGWGSTVGRADAGALGEKWSAAIQIACASWSARRDLTVTALTAHVHPTATYFDVSLTVTNTGSRDGTLSSVASMGFSVHALGAPIRVPARGEATVRLRVVLDTCDSVQGPRDQTSPLTVDPRTTTQFGLVGLAGAVPGVGPQPETSGEGDGFGATGVLLAPAANQALTAALNQACAGLRPMLPLISPDTVRYDRASRELTVPLLIYDSPGRVRSMRLQAQTPSEAGDDTAFRPLWKTIDDLVPDRTGQLKVTLRYRAPASGPCPMRGGYLPSFLATLDVPVPGGERTLRYLGTPDLSQDPRAIPLLCSEANQ
jgi:hypothetical protein